MKTHISKLLSCTATFLLSWTLYGNALSLAQVDAYIYLPSSQVAQDGIIDLLVDPAAGTAPYHVVYRKKQANGQYVIIKDMAVSINGDEDMVGIGVGEYRVELTDYHCHFVSLDIVLALGCGCTAPALNFTIKSKPHSHIVY